MIERVRLVVVLCRPSLVTIFGLFAAVGVSQAGAARSTATLIAVLVPVVAFVLFSVIVNDLADRAIDEVNLVGDRSRPFVGRSVAAREFGFIAVGCGVIALGGAARLGLAPLAVVAGGMTLSIAYSVRPISLSHRGALASLLLPAGYVGVPYLLGILSVRGRLSTVDLVLGAGLYVGFIGRILLKDFRDVRGDTLFGKRTFLVRHGRRVTCLASAVCWILGALALCALRNPSAAVVVAYVAQLAVALVLLHKLASSTSARRDERLIAAIAVVGRGLVLAVLTHLTLADAHWSSLPTAGVMLSLAAVCMGQAAVMAYAGPVCPRRDRMEAELAAMTAMAAMAEPLELVGS